MTSLLSASMNCLPLICSVCLATTGSLMGACDSSVHTVLDPSSPHYDLTMRLLLLNVQQTPALSPPKTAQVHLFYCILVKARAQSIPHLDWVRQSSEAAFL